MRRFTWWAAGSHAAIWAAFLVLTALHIYANVHAMRALCLKTLNCARMDVLLENFLMHQVPNPDHEYSIWILCLAAPEHTTGAAAPTLMIMAVAVADSLTIWGSVCS